MVCKHCGVTQPKGVLFCSSCGAELLSPEAANVAQPVVPDGNFMELMYKHGSCRMFFVGIILYTISAVLGVLLNLPAIGLITLPIVVMPIVGFWQIFNACSKQAGPQGIHNGLTLLKVTAVVLFVLTWVAAFFIGLVYLIAIFNSGEPFVIVSALITAGMFFVVIKFGFLAFFSVIRNIRTSLTHNNVAEIRGANALSMVGFIFGGFAIVFSLLASTLLAFVDNILQEFAAMGGEFEAFADVMPEIGGVMYSAMLINIVGTVGTILVLVVLRRLAFDVRNVTR